jgi:hypothetical protein
MVDMGDMREALHNHLCNHVPSQYLQFPTKESKDECGPTKQALKPPKLTEHLRFDFVTGGSRAATMAEFHR